jgi:hypothetical protein
MYAAQKTYLFQACLAFLNKEDLNMHIDFIEKSENNVLN